MEKISLKEQQQIELEILIYLDKVCKENKIKYSLCGGTLLGAIRHKGFIPWDDDIDIMLARPEYERLISILKQKNEYLILGPETKGNFNMFTKVMDKRTVLKTNSLKELTILNYGIFVDIFPIEGLPNDELQRKNYYHKLEKMSVSMEASRAESYYYSPSKKKMAVKKVLFFPRFLRSRLKASPEVWKLKLDTAMQSYDYKTSEFVGSLLTTCGMKEIMPKEIFEEYIEVEFEGKMFSAVKAYDKYLSALYGDYMELPPIEQRVSPHPYKAYWKGK